MKNELVRENSDEVEAQGESPTKHKKSDTDWRRAYLTLCALIATDWVSSDKVSSYVDQIRQSAGDEAADSLAKMFNTLRSQFMQDFMG